METCYHSNLSERPFANADAKSSKGDNNNDNNNNNNNNNNIKASKIATIGYMVFDIKPLIT